LTGWEIDNIIQSPTGKRMIKRVSPVYDNSVFMKFFYEGEGSEYDKVRKYFMTLREQFNTKTVDWGIVLQERKYSIIPDDSLTLEERRARLKIKLQNKYPLNPAILERIAHDDFNIDVTLDESSKPGYIVIDTKQTGVGKAMKFIKWLIEEKPAHLMLWAIIHKYVKFPAYVGIGSHRYGKISIRHMDDVTISPNKTIVELGERKFIIEPGKVTVSQGDEEYSPVVPTSEQLQLKFAFPTGSRTISFDNPRQDLTTDDINDVRQYAVDNNLLIKADNVDTADDLVLATLVTKTTTNINLDF